MAKKTDKTARKQNVTASEGAAPAQEAEKEVLSEEEARALLEGRNRIHAEALGQQWAVVLGGNPAQLMPSVVGQVISEGGTRAAWQWLIGEQEHVVMAWPSDQPVRAAVVMRTQERGGQFKPCDAFPLLEGLPNDLTVADVHPWEAGCGANVAVTMMEGKNPMWFYDPLYLRDKDDLTPGVTQSFLLSGLAIALRKALLDDVNITQGPQYEAWAAQWLAENPGKTRLDVPPLKISMAGRQLIMPGRRFAELAPLVLGSAAVLAYLLGLAGLLFLAPWVFGAGAAAGWVYLTVRFILRPGKGGRAGFVLSNSTGLGGSGRSGTGTGAKASYFFHVSRKKVSNSTSALFLKFSNSCCCCRANSSNSFSMS